MSQLTLLPDSHPANAPQLAARQSKQMNVIHVPRRFAGSEWGGTETTILETSRALIAKGHSSSIVTTTALCDKEEEDMQGVRIHRHKYVYPFLGLSDQDKRDMDRKGGNLSGGERQMLLMAQCLLGKPELVMMDEPTEGLAPHVIDDLKLAFKKISEQTTLAIIEQNLPLTAEVADRVYAMKEGKVVAEIKDKKDIQGLTFEKYL